jgi:hypothetical protein
MFYQITTVIFLLISVLFVLGVFSIAAYLREILANINYMRRMVKGKVFHREDTNE